MFIEVEGFNINYQIIGNEWILEGNDVLVFLHEGLGSIPQWKDFPVKLSAKLELPAIIYERIGYGKSDSRKSKETPSRFLFYEAKEILPKLIYNLGIKNNIILFGHSDGGTIALIQASNAMPNLKAIVVEAPHIMLEEHSLNGIRNARKMLDNEKLIAVLDRYHNGRAYELIDKWSAHWLKADTQDWDAVDDLKKITVPMLLIQGENDNFGTFAQIDTVKELAKSEIIELAKIQDCGHIPHLQQQELILNLTENFIKRINNG